MLHAASRKHGANVFAIFGRVHESILFPLLIRLLKVLDWESASCFCNFSLAAEYLAVHIVSATRAAALFRPC